MEGWRRSKWRSGCFSCAQLDAYRSSAGDVLAVAMRREREKEREVY
jgi:hypothetical protein